MLKQYGKKKYKKIAKETNLIPSLEIPDDELLRPAYQGGFCFF